jgi:hypothetical protein
MPSIQTKSCRPEGLQTTRILGSLFLVLAGLQTSALWFCRRSEPVLHPVPPPPWLRPSTSTLFSINPG